MKIKKNELKKVIQNYLFEQPAYPVGPEGGTPSERYPEYVTTDNQKAMYDLSNVAKKRRVNHPDSEAGLKWPQDFVLFEKQFESHIANWKLFKREYPNSAFLLQICDMSGVSSYVDLAKSIETTSSGNAGIYDQFVLALNVFSSLPIGMAISALSSGRIAIKALTGLKKSFKGSGTNGFELIHQIFKSSDKFKDLVSSGAIEAFLISKKIYSPEVIKKVIINLNKFLKFIDSFGFRAFVKSWLVIAENFSEEIATVMLEYLASERGAEFLKSSDLAYYLFQTVPEKIGRYLELEFAAK